MTKERFPTYNLIGSILFILLTPNLYAQSDNANDNADNNNGGGTDPFALTVTTSGPLSWNFGSFVNINGGTIEIDPSVPNSSPTTNSPGLLVVRNGGTGPIMFEVSNQATPLKVVNLTCQFTPLSEVSQGTSSLGLAVKFTSSRQLTPPSTFTSTSPSSYTFSINELNPATIYMGGLLTVEPGDLPGTYTGNVTVTIDYP